MAIMIKIEIKIKTKRKTGAWLARYLASATK